MGAFPSPALPGAGSTGHLLPQNSQPLGHRGTGSPHNKPLPHSELPVKGNGLILILIVILIKRPKPSGNGWVKSITLRLAKGNS